MTAVEGPPIEPVIALPLADRFGFAWRFWLVVALLGVAVLLYGLSGPAFRGIGVWGTNVPYVWGFDIASYAWWVGIANGAALFASILVLMRHGLLTSVNRYANGLALAAAGCAAIFPVFHLGHPELAYWMLPYPSTIGVWPQFRSPLTWDFWAILTHFTAIALLWYVGLIPDFATLRDRARGRRRQVFYALLALGWTGSSRQWALHVRAHRLVALSLIPLLFVMQAIVAYEFVGTIVPDWHDTALPLWFIATGLQLGIASTLLVGLALRHRLELREHVERADVDLLGKLLLTTALVTAYGYASEAFTQLLAAGAPGDSIRMRATGPYAALYWGGLLLAVAPPQLLWSRRARLNGVAGTAVSALVLVGVYLAYLSVVVGGIQRERIAIADATYAPTFAEAALLVGTAGLFLAMLLVAVRLLPVVSLYESREHARRRS